jgi:protein TonB
VPRIFPVTATAAGRSGRPGRVGWARRKCTNAMFEVLLASAAPHVVRPARLVGSLLTHAITIGLLVDATRAEGDNRLVGSVDPTLIVVTAPFLTPHTARPRPPAPAPKPRVVKRETIAPAPKGFKTVVAPLDIPPLPPVDLSGPRFDPRDYTGRGVEGGSADGVFGAIRTVYRGKPGGSGEVVFTAATDDFRFQQAVLISQPEPRYPRIAESMGVEGRVLLRFVIDTTGRVDKHSIEVVETTEEQFTPAARESVARAKFRPARMSGTPVRQLAEQSVRFIVRY